MCCNKNRTNARAYTAGAGCRRVNAPCSQRSVPDAYYGQAPYSQDTTTTPAPRSRCHPRRSHPRPCRQGGLVALIVGLIREHRANRDDDDGMASDKSRDDTESHHQLGEDEFETKASSGRHDGDGIDEKTGLFGNDDHHYDHDHDDGSAREAAELPSYEAAVKSG